MWGAQNCKLPRRQVKFNLGRADVYLVKSELRRSLHLFRLKVRGAFFLKRDLTVCALTHIEHFVLLEVHDSLPSHVTVDQGFNTKAVPSARFLQDRWRISQLTHRWST